MVVSIPITPSETKSLFALSSTRIHIQASVISCVTDHNHLLLGLCFPSFLLLILLKSFLPSQFSLPARTMSMYSLDLDTSFFNIYASALTLSASRFFLSPTCTLFSVSLSTQVLVSQYPVLSFFLYPNLMVTYVGIRSAHPYSICQVESSTTEEETWRPSSQECSFQRGPNGHRKLMQIQVS